MPHGVETLTNGLSYPLFGFGWHSCLLQQLAYSHQTVEGIYPTLCHGEAQLWLQVQGQDEDWGYALTSCVVLYYIHVLRPNPNPKPTPNPNHGHEWCRVDLFPQLS